MLVQAKYARPLLTLALLGALTAPAPAKNLAPGVAKALETIKRDATAIEAGKFTGKAIQAPAREIALEWYDAEKVLATDGDVLVETKMTNASITKLESDWQRVKDVRGEAKDIESNVADLESAAKS